MHIDASARVVTIIIALAAEMPPIKVIIGNIEDPLSRVMPST